MPSGEQAQAGDKSEITRFDQSQTSREGFRFWTLTFALVGGLGGQRVAVETLFAAVAEEAVGVVDALEALSVLAVTVPDGVGVDVAAALAAPTRSDYAAILTQRVAEESVVAQLAALTCTQVRSRDWHT